MNYDYDLLVVGSGPAGEKGAAQAAFFGKKVLLIEKQPVLGGACVNTGTLPSKTLRETALYMSGFQQRKLYGVHCRFEAESVAVPDLMCRKQPVIDAEIDRINRNIARHAIELVHGTASFVDRQTLDILLPDGHKRRVTGRIILIAVGSRPARPPGFPWDAGDIEDSDSILKLDRMPASMIVVGGGVIGCEYAGMFQQLNVQVTLLDRGERLLPFLDEEMCAQLGLFFRTMGMQVVHKADIERTEAVKPRGVRVHLRGGERIEADKLLFAAGRVGNIDTLNLAAAGLTANERGQIKVDDHYRTAVENIYAVGDCIGIPALASVSMDQARVAMCDAFEWGYKRRVNPLLPMGIYSIPEISCVGVTEQDARVSGLEYSVGRASYRDNARGQIIGDVDGLLKIIIREPDRKLIGVHIIGDRATELIHIGLSHMHHGATADDLIDTVYNFPTLSECYKYAAYNSLGTKPHIGRGQTSA
jgi:NAD(P) transhydrogenase